MIWRYRFVLLLIVGFFLLIFSRLFYWQVVKAEELSSLGQSQYGRFIKLYPRRGEILSADNFPLVSNKLSYLVFANPKQIKDKKKTVDELSSLLKVDSASMSALLSLDKLWVPLGNKVDEDTKTAIYKKNFPGIGFEEQSTRFYPEASMAASLLGFVGKNSIGEDKGYVGLEGYYDLQLRGKPGLAVEVSDVFGRPILSRMDNNTKEVTGRSLILSLDRAIQFMAEQSLKDGIEKYGAEGGMVGIINPKTGGLLAMVSFPSFDPRTYYTYEERLYKNPFISNLYEPGSTFKSLIMAAGLDGGVVKPDTTCPSCDKPASIGGYEIRTWNNQYQKDISMIDVILHSDNTGMVYVSQQLGLERMVSYLEKFGIGQTTGIDLEGETASVLKDKEKWYSIDVATTSFGQGISVTPIELLDAFSSLANGGVRMAPHVVEKIQTSDEQIIILPTKELSRPVSAKTAKIMTEMLVNAVNNGEAKWARLKDYRIAGKTGTAQIPIAGHYDPNKTIASFIGFAPADDPKFAMLVIIDRPTSSIYGSETAAPIFFDIARKILQYYQIPPTGQEEVPSK